MSVRLICGDNLPVLKAFPAESIDLCYIDPPFFTSKTYEVIWGDGAEVRMFEDRWVKSGDGRYSKDINVYLNFMEPRLREIHRVLKDTGSFYLHCDWHADSYLRVLCDTIFGYDNLVNSIAWCYSGGGVPKKGYARKHDTVMFYRKLSDFTFNRVYVPYKDPKGKHSGGLPYREEGKVPEDWWIDLVPVSTASKERLGYPTQKPESLLERIISASSNPGDVVLDAFCGCGTTLAVAKRLGRTAIGIDVSPTACRLVAGRVSLKIEAVEGLPLTLEEVSTLTGYEFQNYIIGMLVGPGHDPTGKVTVGGRGADGGLDGKFFGVPISVKKYKAGRTDLDGFVATLYREKAKDGIFLALDYSADFRKEVARLGREDDLTVVALTLEDVVERRHVPVLKRFRTDLDGIV